MKNIYCLNNISTIGLNALSKDYQLVDQVDHAKAVLVRSASMHDYALPSSVLAVARAGAGVNNIPLDLYAKAGVVVMNTPGANANAVKELTLAGMFLASRDIFGGMKWLKENKEDPEITKTVEKVKAQFGGTEIHGKTIGIIGLGAIGLMLAHACHHLGMKVIGTKRNLESLRSDMLPEQMILVKTKEELFPVSDFISLNLPLLPETKYMINKEAFNKMKDGVILLNFARDQLVQDDDLKEAIESKKIRAYVTDFPNSKTAKLDRVIAIPHLGASTEEAEDNCAYMAAKQVVNYVDHGIILNSVNYPDLVVEHKKTNYRLAVLYENKQNRSEEILQLIEKYVKTVHTFHSSNTNYRYSLYDFNETIADKMSIELNKLDGVFKSRIIE
jgi:D-3-phosphoglycerate dehydrogenase / 2-oxoglutarate reductase